jgi:hypothetical protein
MWRPVADALEADGRPTTIAQLPARRTAAGVLAAFVQQAAATGARVLVAHSNAGLYLPAVAAALAEPVDVVFVDAALPGTGPEAQLAAPDLQAFLAGLVGPDGLLPRWSDWWPEADVAGLFPDPETRAAVEAEEVRVALDYFRATVPVPTGWTSCAHAYLAFGHTYAAETARAVSYGWPTRILAGRHLHLLHDPRLVADAVVGLGTELAARRLG